jgi:hypothetical protein
VDNFNIRFLALKKHREEIFILCGGICLFVLTLFLPPLADDWAYLASPRIRDLSLAHYRRLCDVLIGTFLQSHPGWFPMLNRILIITSHTVCALLFFKISKTCLKVNSLISLCFALFFLIGGNTIITVINYDCFNQTGSLMFGTMGIYFFLISNKKIHKFVIYLAACILSLCVKESGIVYFAIIPLFGTVKSVINNEFNIKNESKTLAMYYIPGIVLALSYYFSPIIQSEKLWVYGMGDYTVLNYIKGIFRRIVFAYSQINQLSISEIRFNRSIGVFFMALGTILLSMPMLVVSAVSFVNMIKKRSISVLVILLLVSISIIVFTPTLLAMPSPQWWSYNCIVFFANLVFCYILNTIKKQMIINVGVITFGLSSLITTADICVKDYQTTVRQRIAIEKMQSVFSKKSIQNYIVYNINSHQGKRGLYYPGGLFTIQQLFDLGGDLVCVFGYGAKCKSINLSNEVFEYKGNKWAQPEYLNLSDSEFLIHCQTNAKKMVESGEYDLALVVCCQQMSFICMNKGYIIKP